MRITDTVSKTLIFMALHQRAALVTFHPASAVVPKHLRNDAKLSFLYGDGLPIPIADLEVSEEGLRATLSFDRTPHETFVPWSAVIAISGVDDSNVVPLFRKR